MFKVGAVVKIKNTERFQFKNKYGRVTQATDYNGLWVRIDGMHTSIYYNIHNVEPGPTPFELWK